MITSLDFPPIYTSIDKVSQDITGLSIKKYANDSLITKHLKDISTFQETSFPVSVLLRIRFPWHFAHSFPLLLLSTFQIDVLLLLLVCECSVELQLRPHISRLLQQSSTSSHFSVFAHFLFFSREKSLHAQHIQNFCSIFNETREFLQKIRGAMSLSKQEHPDDRISALDFLGGHLKIGVTKPVSSLQLVEAMCALLIGK